jgi:murein peptide amidase A
MLAAALLGALVVGQSSQGVPLRGQALGTGAPRVLVVGCIHGTECAGLAIVSRLERECAAGSGRIWVLPNLNPDGYRRRVRQNGRGVDLNRNFPYAWRGGGAGWDPEYAGPRPLSEPETRAAVFLVDALRPEVTIWYHQPLSLVRAWGSSIPPARRYARVAHARFRKLPWLAGTAPNWQNHTFPGTASFVVELKPGPLSPAAARRHARAVEALAGGC